MTSHYDSTGVKKHPHDATPMTPRYYTFALWFVLIASGLLIIWQGLAFFSDRIPNHILPLVRLLSGTQESIPVAYSWTLRLGLLSVVAFVSSALLLVWQHFTRRNTRR